MEADGGVTPGDGDNLDDLQKRWEQVKREIGTEIEGEAEAAIWWGSHVAAWEDAVEQREKEVEERALRLADIERARSKACHRLREEFRQQERLLLREKAVEEEKVDLLRHERLLLREKVLKLEEEVASRTRTRRLEPRWLDGKGAAVDQDPLTWPLLQSQASLISSPTPRSTTAPQVDHSFISIHKVTRLELALGQSNHVESTSERKDHEKVKFSLRVLTRLGENFDEKALHSVIHETLKAVVARYSADEIITQRESVSMEVRNELTERARNLEVVLDDVSITSLRLLTATEEAEHAKFIGDNKTEKDNNSATARVQVLGSERSTARDVYACPYLVESSSKSKDLQMVKIGLCVLTKLGGNFDDKALLSIIHETLEVVVAQYNASQILSERESQIMSMEIRNKLTEKAINFNVVLDDVFITSLGLLNAAGHGHTKFTDGKTMKDNMIAIIRATGDETWTKRLNGYVFFLGVALSMLIIVRPLLPLGYDKWMLAVFATLWGLGSIGIPLGIFGTTRLEKNISRHVGRFISLCFSMMVIYATYLLVKPLDNSDASTSEPQSDVEIAWIIIFTIIGFMVSAGHIISWVLGCRCGGDKDTEPS